MPNGRRAGQHLHGEKPPIAPLACSWVMLSLAGVEQRTVLPSPSTGNGPTLNILSSGQNRPNGYLS